MSKEKSTVPSITRERTTHVPASLPDAGASVLDAIEAFATKYVVYPSVFAQTAHVLWIAHTWFMDAWEKAPRIAFLSPEPGSGKSTCLDVTEELVPRPVRVADASSAYVAGMVDAYSGDPGEHRPVILHDEIDGVFGPISRQSTKADSLRVIYNNGYDRRGGVGRMDRGNNDRMEAKTKVVFGAAALSGLGTLPNTLHQRSIIIPMRRNKPGERVASWRSREVAAEAGPIRERLSDWAAQVTPKLLAQTDYPKMPPDLEGRDADKWEPLIWVGDLAGGDWPNRARAAAVSMVKADKGEQVTSDGVKLLGDVRTVFLEQQTDRLLTTDLLSHLNSLEGAPWGGYNKYGQSPGLNAHQLANLLGGYEIRPQQMRVGADNKKGYRLDDFVDAFERYLPSSCGGNIRNIRNTTGAGADKPAASAWDDVEVRQPGSGREAGTNSGRNKVCIKCGTIAVDNSGKQKFCRDCGGPVTAVPA